MDSFDVLFYVTICLAWLFFHLHDYYGRKKINKPERANLCFNLGILMLVTATIELAAQLLS